MGKGIFVGVNGVARKPKNIYVGVNGVARKVKAAYVGVNGVAKQIWPGSRIPDNNYEELEYITPNNINTTILSAYNTRIVMEFMISSGATITSGGFPIVITWYAGTDYESIDYKGDGYTVQAYTVGFEFRNDASNTSFYSNTTEKILRDNLYTFDLNNNDNFYIYSNTGYYSLAANNYVGRLNRRTVANSGNNTVIFGGYGGSSNYSLHLAKVYTGSTLSGEFVPAMRKSDSKYGLYNLTTRLFCPNGS